LNSFDLSAHRNAFGLSPFFRGQTGEKGRVGEGKGTKRKKEEKKKGRNVDLVAYIPKSGIEIGRNFPTVLDSDFSLNF